LTVFAAFSDRMMRLEAGHESMMISISGDYCCILREIPSNTDGYMWVRMEEGSSTAILLIPLETLVSAGCVSIQGGLNHEDFKSGVDYRGTFTGNIIQYNCGFKL
jgi:hypothetical protein